MQERESIFRITPQGLAATAGRYVVLATVQPPDPQLTKVLVLYYPYHYLSRWVTCIG